MTDNDAIPTSTEKAQLFETTAPLLRAMQAELKKFAQKKPEMTLSKPKVAFINRLLQDLRELLRDESNIKYLDLLDDEALPQYSDVVLVISQYEAALSAFHHRHTVGEEFSLKRDWVYSPRRKK